MLRLLVLVLLAANLGYLAWSRGYLMSVLPVPPHQQEPQRKQLEVRPESIRLLSSGADGSGAGTAGAAATPAAAGSAPSGTTATPASGVAAVGAASAALPAAAASAPVGTAGVCLEAGPYSETEFAQVRTTLEATLANGTWVSQRNEGPGVFLVYIGRFPTREALLERQADLRQQGIRAEEVRSSPGFEPGLSLGRYTSRPQADARQAELERQGVRSARVIVVTAPRITHMVRVPAADTDLTTRLENLRSRLAGRSFVPCRPPPVAAAAST